MDFSLSTAAMLSFDGLLFRLRFCFSFQPNSAGKLDYHESYIVLIEGREMAV